MIGIDAFLQELAFFLVPLLMLAVTLFFARRSSGTGRWTAKSLIAPVALSLLLIVGATGFFREVNNHFFFARLDTAMVESVLVGDHLITDSAQKTLVVRALKDLDWFTVSHGGLASDVPLEIRLKSGKEHRFRVALYLRETGAVVLFGESGGFQAGYGFSKDLPNALKELGVSLPTRNPD